MCTRAHYKSIWRRRTKKRERERIMEPRRREATLFCVSMNRRFHHGLFTVESQQINVAKKKKLKKTNFMTIGFQIALWKICAKYRPFQIVSFMQEARISYTKKSQTKSRTFHNNLSVCGLLIIRYISPRLIKDKVEVQFLGKFFSSDALRVFLYQFIAISRGTGC